MSERGKKREKRALVYDIHEIEGSFGSAPRTSRFKKTTGRLNFLLLSFMLLFIADWVQNEYK